jgi:hypothetical protein
MGGGLRHDFESVRGHAASWTGRRAPVNAPWRLFRRLQRQVGADALDIDQIVEDCLAFAHCGSARAGLDAAFHQA